MLTLGPGGRSRMPYLILAVFQASRFVTQTETKPASAVFTLSNAATN